MIHQAEVIVRVGVPRPVDVQRSRGLAAFGVAQIGRDNAKLVLELVHRIERMGREPRDRGVQTATGNDQQRGAGPRPPRSGCGCRPSTYDGMAISPCTVWCSTGARASIRHASIWSRRAIRAQWRLASAYEGLSCWAASFMCQKFCFSMEKRGVSHVDHCIGRPPALTLLPPDIRAGQRQQDIPGVIGPADHGDDVRNEVNGTDDQAGRPHKAQPRQELGQQYSNRVCGMARSTSTRAIRAKPPMAITVRNEKNASNGVSPRVCEYARHAQESRMRRLRPLP